MKFIELPLELKTARLRLKTLTPKEASNVVSYLLDSRSFFDKWGPAVEDEYFKSAFQKERLITDIEKMEQGKLLRLWVFKNEDLEQPIGDIGFSQIIWGGFQSCFLGYKIAERENGKGYATEAIEAGVDYVFNQMKLHRIEANIIPRNTASIRVVEKLGFEKEGLAKRYLKINGCWEDHLHFVKWNQTVE